MNVKRSIFFRTFIIITIIDLVLLDLILGVFYLNGTASTLFFIYVLFDLITILGFWLLYKLYIKNTHLLLLLISTVLLFPLIIIISQTIFAVAIGIQTTMPLLNGILSSLILNTIITFEILYRIWLPLSLVNFVIFAFVRYFNIKKEMGSGL